MLSKLFLPILVVFLASQAACERDCLNRQPVDVQARARAADVVVSGQVKKLLRSNDSSQYAAEILVYWIYKGQSHFPSDFVEPAPVFVMGFGPEDDCRNEVELGDTLLFFLMIDTDEHLTLNYYWDADNVSFADGVAPMQLLSLDQTVEVVDVVRSECDNSLFGCCPDGVTTRKTFGDDSTCVVRTVEIVDPEPDNRIVETIKGPINLLDMLGVTSLPNGVYINTDESTCPDVSLMAFYFDPTRGPILHRKVANVFDGYNEFPREFAILGQSKQISGDESYFLVSMFDAAPAWGVRLTPNTVEFIYANVSGKTQSVEFTKDLTDGQNHRFAFAVSELSVSLYVDCELVHTHLIPRNTKVSMDGYISIGSNDLSNSNYHGIIEKLQISSNMADASNLCSVFPACPVAPTAPIPTAASSTLSPPDSTVPTVTKSVTVETPTVVLSASGEEPTPSDDPVTCGDDTPCPFYGVCMDDGCHCPICMSETTTLVCGSDEVTYATDCAVRRTSCVEKRMITYRNGTCDEEIETSEPTSKPTTEPTSSGKNPIEYSGAICLGEVEPLLNSFGNYLSCSEDNDCPKESSCDITAQVCCPVVSTPTPIPTEEPECDMSVFGCCRDGVTSARGVDYRGCPGELNLMLELANSPGVSLAPPFCPTEQIDALAFAVSSEFELTVSTQEIYPKHFPKQFSILMTFLLMESTHGTILTVYGAQRDIQLSVSVTSEGLALEYVSTAEGQRRSIVVNELAGILNDGKYHRVAVSWYNGEVTFYVDCGEGITRVLDQQADLVFDAMGAIRIGKKLLCERCGIQGAIEQLSIIPDPAAARKQCDKLPACPTTQPPTTPQATTTQRTTTQPATTQPATTQPATTQATTTQAATTQAAATTHAATTHSRAPGQFVVPQFSTAGSYLQFDALSSSRGFSLDMSFTATGSDGIMFYADDPDSGDFVALSYENRVVVLRVNDGSGTVTVESEGKKLKKGEQFKAVVSIKKSTITLNVESRKRATKDRGQGEKFTLTNVFVGGIPSDQQTIEDAQVVRGFQGCVHLLNINEKDIDLQSFAASNSVFQCGDRPPDDVSTPSAEKTTTTQASTATQAPPPLGTLSFAAASYLAFDPPEDSRSFVLDMEFIVTGNDGLMFYVANKKSGDFVLASYLERRIRVSVNNGSAAVQLISGGKNLKKGTKFRFTLLVKSGTVTLSVDGRSRQRADRDTSKKFKFGDNLTFIGGLPADVEPLSMSLPSGSSAGFEGCVFDVSVNSVELDFTSPRMYNDVSQCKEDGSDSQ